MKRVVLILLWCLAPVIMIQGQQQAGVLLSEAIYEEEVKGNLDAAIKSFKFIVSEFPGQRTVAAEALLHLGMCYEKLGLKEAREAYQSLIDDYPEQTDKVSLASDRLARIEQVYSRLDHGPSFRKIRFASDPENGVLSPDGKRLAFMSEDAIWLVPLQGRAGPDIAGEPDCISEIPGLWDGSGMISWSADGKWIAIYGKDGVHVVPVAGGEPRVVQLPEQGGHLWSYRMSLSPDGRKLAFSAIGSGIPEEDVADPHDRRIYTIPTDGGPPVQLTSIWSTMPAFSPDGRYIAFVGYRKREVLPENSHLSRVHGDLHIIDARNGDPLAEVRVDGRLRGPIWSPDGKYIAAHLEPGGDNDSKEIVVFKLSKDASGAQEVERITLPRSSWNMLAGWSPDNKIGVFIQREEHTALYTVPVKGGKAMQILPEGGWPYYPRWSRDGERIYFRGYDEGDDKDITHKITIQYVPSEGGIPELIHYQPERWLVSIIPGGGFNISPDGKRLVMSAYQEPYNPEEGGDIWILPVEGGIPFRLTSDETYESHPCWSPDGRWIAFTDTEIRSNGEEYDAIFTIPAEGGAIRKITTESDSVAGGAIAYSPDNKSIAYFSENAIKSIPVEGGQSDILVSNVNPHRHSKLAFSPDGTKLAYNAERKIWIQSLEGGSPQELQTGLPVEAVKGEFSWSPDGEKIVFFSTQGGEEEFWLVSDFKLPD